MTTTMTRKSTHRVSQGRTRSTTPIHPLTAIKQPSSSIACSKSKQEYLKRRRRQLAFAAHRKKRSEWVAIAHDTQQVVLGDGNYTAQTLCTSSSPLVSPSPFQCAVPVVTRPQGNAHCNAVYYFYNIAPQIVISQQGTTFYPHCSPDLANWRPLSPPQDA